MIPKIQGSTQMPASMQQPEVDSAQPGKKKESNSPVNHSDTQERTAPQPQRRNPDNEMKFEGHARATDLHAQLDSNNGASGSSALLGSQPMEEVTMTVKKSKDDSSSRLFDNTPMDEVTISAQKLTDGSSSGLFDNTPMDEVTLSLKSASPKSVEKNKVE